MVDPFNTTPLERSSLEKTPFGTVALVITTLVEETPFGALGGGKGQGGGEGRRLAGSLAVWACGGDHLQQEVGMLGIVIGLEREAGREEGGRRIKGCVG